MTDFETLLETSRKMAEESKSSSTRRAYAIDFGLFIDFCHGLGVPSLPACPETVAAYLSDCFSRKLAVSTVSRYLTSISQAHKLSSAPNPVDSPQVKSVLSGYRRERGIAPSKVRPITLEQLRRCVSRLGTSIMGLRDAAILTIGWSAALRRSEISALKRSDVESVPEGLVIHVRRSKTDQEGIGRSIGIPFGSDEFCPVAVIRRWYIQAQIDDGPLFFPLYRGANTKWFIPRGNHKKLGDRSIANIVKKSLELSGYDSVGYSGHSLRSGFCTAAARAGIPEYSIMAHTGHRSERVMRGYIREGSLFRTNPLSVLFGPGPSRADRVLPEIKDRDDKPDQILEEREADLPSIP